MKAIAVKGILQDQEGKILMLKRSDFENFDKGFWDLPGGRLERKENMLHGLVREINEETGLIINDMQLINSWTYKPNENLKIKGFTFYCKKYVGKIVLSKEHNDYKWLSYDEIIKIDAHNNLKKEILKILNSNGKISLWNRLRYYKFCYFDI